MARNNIGIARDWQDLSFSKEKGRKEGFYFLLSKGKHIRNEYFSL